MHALRSHERSILMSNAQFGSPDNFFRLLVFLMQMVTIENSIVTDSFNSAIERFDIDHSTSTFGK